MQPKIPCETNSMTTEHQRFGWQDSGPHCGTGYILPTVLHHVETLFHGKPVRVLDLGCGNGYAASELARMGHRVTAIDVSADGIGIARSAFPAVRFEVCSVYADDLAKHVPDPVDCVISLEVVEHLFYPKMMFAQSYKALRPDGKLIVSTPYHGYLKNLALAVLDGWDRHLDAFNDGGHIKFFSKKTLAKMACDAGFRNPRIIGVGRLPWLWKSMIMVADK